jgi:hypothetical protein
MLLVELDLVGISDEPALADDVLGLSRRDHAGAMV